MESAIVLLVGLVAILIFLALFTYFIPLGLWVSAYFAGVKVAIFRDLVGMRLRKVPPSSIVRPMISATKAGLQVELDLLEAHFLAGGDVNSVILALIAADKANIPLTFERATAIDLAGRDVLEAVKMSVNPKMIKTSLIAAVAKDGIQLKAAALVTVRANIDRLVGGAGEEKIIAASVKVSSLRSVHPPPTRTSWSFQIASPRPCWPKDWIRARPLRFCLLI